MQGTYKQEIKLTENLPGCFIVLLDHLASMERFGKEKRLRAAAMARAVSTLL